MNNSVRGTSSSDSNKKSRIRSRQSLSTKQFDTKYFNRLIQQREFLAQQSDHIRSISWTNNRRRYNSNHTTPSVQTTASRALNFDSYAHSYTEFADRIDRKDVIWQQPIRKFENRAERYHFQNEKKLMNVENSKSQSLEMPLQAQQYHARQPVFSPSKHSLSNGYFRDGTSSKNKRNVSLSNSKQSSSLSRSLSDITSSSSNARMALAELGSKYKPLSPSCISEVSGKGNSSAASRSQEIQYSYVSTSVEDVAPTKFNGSFDLFTAAESQDKNSASIDDFASFKDDTISALLTSTASLTDTLTFEQDCMLQSANIPDEYAAQNANIYALRTTRNRQGAEKSPNDSKANDDDRNVDYLLQLSTLIGRSPSTASTPLSPHEQNSIELASVESFHSSNEIDMCVKLTAFDHDDTSVLSAISFDYVQTIANSQTIASVPTPGRSKKAKGSVMFRWCGLLWLISLMLVYERSINNEIYLISQRRRIIEDELRETIEHLSKMFNESFDIWIDRPLVIETQMFVDISNKWTSAREWLDSYIGAGAYSSLLTNSSHAFDANLHQDILRLGGLVDAHVDDIIFGTGFKSKANELHVNEWKKDLCSQFYEDMMTCSGTDSTVVDKSFLSQSPVIAFRFYQDMLFCSDGTNTDDSKGDEQTIAIYSQFYQDMVLSFAIDESLTTSIIPILFYQQMMGYFEDEKTQRQDTILRNGGADALQYYFEQDMNNFYWLKKEFGYVESLEEIAISTEGEDFTESFDFYFYRDMTIDDRITDPDLYLLQFWSKEQTKIPFLSASRELEPIPMKMELIDINGSHSMENTENRLCLLSHIGPDLENEVESNSNCQYLFSADINLQIRQTSLELYDTQNAVRTNMAIEYFNEKKDADVDAPILEVILDFFRVIGKSWKQKRKDKKRAKRQQLNRRKINVVRVWQF